MNPALIRRATIAAVSLSVLAALALAWSFFTYVPLRVDGGWYAYPALALAQGRDPGENQLSVEALESSRGLRAQFEWNSRRSLYVLPAAAWFEAFGHGFLSTRAFGITTMLLALGAALLMFMRHGGDRTVALLFWCLLLLDIKVLGSGVADMRPDLLLAAAAIAAFLLMHVDVRQRFGWKVAGSVVVAAALPLIHMTAPICLALLFCYGLARVAQERGTLLARQRILWAAMAIAAVACYLGRNTLLDVIVPTKIVEPYEFDLGHRVWAAIRGGVLAKAAIEGERWGDYFLISNVFQLLAVLVGFAAVIWGLMRARSGWLRTPEAALAFGCAAGLGVVVLFDPIPRGDHVIPLVPFLMLLSSRMLTQTCGAARTISLQTSIVALVIGAALLKGLHGWKIQSTYADAGVTNANIRYALSKTLPSSEPLVIIGPAEIWPYAHDFDVLIIDERNRPRQRTEQELAAIDYVVMNDEFIFYRWAEKFATQHPGVQLLPVTEVGRRGGPYYLVIYRLAVAPSPVTPSPSGSVSSL